MNNLILKDDIKEKEEEPKMELAIILSISELIMKHGIPVALQLVKDWNVENPTMEDIMELKNRVPRPSTYFEN